MRKAFKRRHSKDNLLYVYILIISLGFFCNFFATILPFWFAKYPSASTRFLSLGLWEICLEEFISPYDQQRVYTGCFYIFDSKIRALWPLIFTGWFHAAQALQIFAMVLHSALMGCGLSMLFGVFDKRKPKIVAISVTLVIFVCWVLITQLGVVGVNIDLEKRQTEIRGEDTWMAETKLSGLSWSYGLAAFALFFVLIALNILVWCVYPRKIPGGSLLDQAWHWPNAKDLPCCFARTPSYKQMVLQETMRSHSLSTQRQPRLELTDHQRNAISPSGETDISSTDVTTYDPRPAGASNIDARNVIVLPALPSKAGDSLDRFREEEQVESRSTSQYHDPRTAIDMNFSRVSSRMSSFRSSTNEASSGFSRAQNRTYVIKKGRYQTTPQTIIPKPLLLGKPH